MTTSRKSSRRAGLPRKVLPALAFVLFSAVIALFVLGSKDEHAPAAPLSAATEPASKPIADLPNAPQRVGAVQVAVPTLDVGQQPLDETVVPSFTLQNFGSTTARLTGANIEVLEGCCPQKPVASSSTIAPGESATVGVPMMMHKGMDGPHLFHVTVAVDGGAGETGTFHLYVKGDFR